MHLSIAPLLEVYKTNTQFLLHVLRDISEEDIVKRPSDKTNSMHFIVGHTASSRFMISRMVGLPDETPWGDLFTGGAKLKEQSDYPPFTELISQWKSISEKMIEKMSGLSDDEVKAKAPRNFPVDDKTIAGALAFMTLHESYHIGQLAYIRKLLGYESAVG